MSRRRKPGQGVLSEETVRQDPNSQSPQEENPYWRDDFDPPPPPATGCIRRGLCCRTNPGWFAPGEVEKAAKLLELPADEFVRTYLIIDAVELEDEGRVEVFAPVKLDRFGKPAFAPATRVDDWYRTLPGSCIFFADNGCRIYEARPIECRAYLCSNLPEENLSKEEVGGLWREG